MNTYTKANAMDGFDVWFFGGTPGPTEDHDCTLSSTEPAIGEDDDRIPSYAHRCDCGKHAAAPSGASANPARSATRQGLLALHI
jgi:hypothetical protein